MPTDHSFRSIAFPENFVLKDLARAYPEARAHGARELGLSLGTGVAHFYPFGAVTFQDVDRERQEGELQRLRANVKGLSDPAAEEEFVVRDGEGNRLRMETGRLLIDSLTEARAEVVALIVAQSAAMEYYEKLLVEMYDHTARLVERLERTGTVTYRVRTLHRFIGHAVATRTEVLSVLHLLDKPDATWDDPEMDRIYDELRAEFDLLDRFHALEAKLKGLQEALELVLDVARDRRLFTIEAAIVVLIVFEIVLSLVRH
jgi:uncharacterized Rmd1/YagE family protein